MAREEIEDEVLRRLDMVKPDKDGWIYFLTIPDISIFRRKLIRRRPVDHQAAGDVVTGPVTSHPDGIGRQSLVAF